MKAALADGSASFTVDWSYRTSPNATKFGVREKGCWTVSASSRRAGIYPEAVAAFKNEDDARADAVKRNKLLPSAS